jgi:hypothetical protein
VLNRSPHPIAFFRFDAQKGSQRFIGNLICWSLLALSSGCGDGTAERTKVSFSDIRDGKDITFIAAEVTIEKSVPWTKPVDLVFDEQFPRFDGGRLLSNPTLLGLADGGVFSFYLRPEIDREKFRQGFTIDGGKHMVRGDVFNCANYYPEGFAFRDPVVPSETDASDTNSVELAQTRVDRMGRFKKVMQALHSYHREKGHLPPAVVYGKDGKPWHSWRVLILPFLGHEYLYKEYDQSVPWDDPKNQAVLERIPEPYVIGEFPNPTSFKTSVALITGKGTAFPLEKE